jgi:NADH-quinone oxidoreductase subunit M
LLSVVVFLPVGVAAVLLAVPGVSDRVARATYLVATGLDLAIVVGLWVAFHPSRVLTDGFAFEENVRWIPTVNSGYHIGVDGLSLPLVALTAVLFFACAIYTLRQNYRVRSFVALFLFLETVSLGLFVSLDLLLFFVFFDLSIAGMYFVIAGWGHGERQKAALKFFLFTFIGSLVLLLGFIGLYLAAKPNTFDMVALTRSNPLKGSPAVGGLVLLAVGIGLAIKTPTFPVHTWLPPAHTEAPAAGSAILAGVLLKMGTYGFVRIAMPMLPDAWRRYAWVVVVIGVVSVLYGALVALAQTNFKRMVAYTSVNHMGYIILGVGAAGLVAGSEAQARSLAVTGAVVQMVSHGLLTGAMFLLAGVLLDRGGSYDMNRYGGLAGPAPVFAGLTAVAAFGGLGLPGLSGFIAEFQVFTGSLSPAPVPTALAFFGILISAALFLWALQRIFLGELRSPVARITDVTAAEISAIAPLLVLSIAIGLFPRFLLDVIEPASQTLISLVSR